ncbi:hypothetical protein CBR_g30353 [Chara braunii]|uniref:Uncharacterized protein n=1 Tax=Chara braunii TaxID=69332 RepID=A0A388JX71_CHABU|nr:hypothetical protein CBR_g30353 [Chara braunii]|eukprot:GBG62400.1 hypothetical protein CBR_g30353 [Chara braunii]
MVPSQVLALMGANAATLQLPLPVPALKISHAAGIHVVNLFKIPASLGLTSEAASQLLHAAGVLILRGQELVFASKVVAFAREQAELLQNVKRSWKGIPSAQQRFVK